MKNTSSISTHVSRCGASEHMFGDVVNYAEKSREKERADFQRLIFQPRNECTRDS